ncbi:zinc finger CCHC domain-containing protein 8 isoform X2 [Procambarus clarkii]|uniref:zinc finger CCHC domain-containing protein 8 isoform X2 n=1 Tax=Procambarus clarkii TaxID=6728 RepID=UPI00374498D5
MPPPLNNMLYALTTSFINMPKEGEDRSIKDEAPSLTDVITEDNSSSCKITENVESESELLKEDSVSEDVSKNPDDSSFPDDVIVLDTTAEANTDEICKSSYEVVMPEGVCLDTDGDETNIAEDISGEFRAPLGVVPEYETGFAGVLTDVEFSMITGKKINDARPKKRCFNCSGDHNLSDCPHPQDAATIATNRKKHINTRGPNVRYHEDSENKFGHFQPGKISEALRHALGLKHNQLPLFIYRMRVLGYPPGWLLDAEVHQADVKMYDASGESVSHPDTEEGEDEPTSIKYKPERLVSFPGFNDPTPRGVRDEGQQYNFPPMQHCHQRTEFLRFMNMNKAEAYKKKKLKGSEMRSKSLNASIAAGAEMDVDGKFVKYLLFIMYCTVCRLMMLPPVTEVITIFGTVTLRGNSCLFAHFPILLKSLIFSFDMRLSPKPTIFSMTFISSAVLSTLDNTFFSKYPKVIMDLVLSRQDIYSGKGT